MRAVPVDASRILSNSGSAAQRIRSNNTTPDYNTATGNSALFYNTTGSDNTADGVIALQFNTTGSGNTASG